MIYLVGVEHTRSQWQYQDGSNENSVARFTNFLRKHIKLFDIRVIAEELSEECLEQQGVAASTAQTVAQEFHIKHLFCDPSVMERKELGILSHKEISEQLFPNKPYWQIPEDSLEQQKINEEIRKLFPKREKFWLNKIKHLRKENVIFICGKSHVESFRNLLDEYGFEISILYS
jgi:hypothetical protein